MSSMVEMYQEVSAEKHSDLPNGAAGVDGNREDGKSDKRSMSDAK